MKFYVIMGLRLITPVAGIIAYLLLNMLFPQGFTSLLHNVFVNRLASIQLIGVAIALSVMVITVRIQPQSKTILRWGNWNAYPTDVKWLGISSVKAWWRNALELVIVISLATGVFMYISVQHFSLEKWITYLPFIVIFSLINAFNEEIIVRFGVVGGMIDNENAQQVWLYSAVIFGIPHYWGQPSGIIGVIMASTLGWILAKMAWETQGLGLGWLIHVIQDVIILSFIVQQL